MQEVVLACHAIPVDPLAAHPDALPGVILGFGDGLVWVDSVAVLMAEPLEASVCSLL